MKSGTSCRSRKWHNSPINMKSQSTTPIVQLGHSTPCDLHNNPNDIDLNILLYAFYLRSNQSLK